MRAPVDVAVAASAPAAIAERSRRRTPARGGYDLADLLRTPFSVWGGRHRSAARSHSAITPLGGISEWL